MRKTKRMILPIEQVSQAKGHQSRECQHLQAGKRRRRRRRERRRPKMDLGTAKMKFLLETLNLPSECPWKADPSTLRSPLRSKQRRAKKRRSLMKTKSSTTSLHRCRKLPRSERKARSQKETLSSHLVYKTSFINHLLILTAGPLRDLPEDPLEDLLEIQRVNLKVRKPIKHLWSPLLKSRCPVCTNFLAQRQSHLQDLLPSLNRLPRRDHLPRVSLLPLH